MKCSEITADLSAYLDGELAESRVLVIQDHLSTCSSCQEMMDLLMSTKRAFVALPSEDVSPDFSQRIQAEFKESPKASRSPWRVLVAPLAVAASLVFLFLWNQDGIRSEQPSVPLGYSEITAQMLKMDFRPKATLIPEISSDQVPYYPCLDPKETSRPLGFCESPLS